MYSSWGVFAQPHTHLLDPDEMGSYGYLARNKLYNGKGSTIDCDGAKQWIVEDNEVTGDNYTKTDGAFTKDDEFCTKVWWVLQGCLRCQAGTQSRLAR